MTNILKVTHLGEIRKRIKTLSTYPLLVCIDDGVYEEYKVPLNLEDKAFHLYKIPSGEKAKTFESLKDCLEFFLSCNISRQTHLVAVGGGAVSDTAAFASSILLRGISWSCIPTTLLSMVDAAIGGKTGVNMGGSKNQIGTFHRPENVMICFEFLHSLPKREWESGLGEIVKYCFLNPMIYKIIMEDDDLENVILACAHYKKELTQEDFRELGRRKILNLGHTLGHTFESLFCIPHGRAVVWGMFVLFKVLGRTKALNQMEDILKKLKLDKGPTPWGEGNFPVNDVLDRVKRDKKKVGEEMLEIVDCLEVGEVGIQNIGFQEFSKLLTDHIQDFTFVDF